MIEIRVLGPVEASVAGEALGVGGAKQRAVLAMLALQANGRVSADHLIAGLWGEEPPVSAAKMVQNYVWRLRTAMPQDAGTRIVTRGRGYELRIDPARVDVVRFERLLAEAERAAGVGGTTTAAREALGLWRGPALADVADEPFAAPEIRRLDELRADAAERAIDADLAAGRHHEVVAEIDALAHDHPLREHVHAQRMLALYRCGRQADALEAYREARRVLVEVVGVEPGAELRRLHKAILEQDPVLDVEPIPPELPRALDPTGAPPLVGRGAELDRLRVSWVRAGVGRTALIIGESGMGKTRLAAELAAEVNDAGAAVLYAAGNESPAATLAVLRRAREVQRPTLVVIDDADSASAVSAAAAELSGELAGTPLLLVATARDPRGLSDSADDTLVLGALPDSAVAAIARRYVDGSRAADGQVAALVAASGGVPRRVHELAAAWARRDAERRVNALVPRTAAGRRELHEAEMGLAMGIAALHAARDRVDAPTADTGSPVCPFKGLASFDVADAPYFFGRDRLVAELIARAVGARMVAVVGPSGSGKSSVVRAGFLAAIAAGVLPGSAGWRQAVIRPGEHPLSELRRTGFAERSAERIVLVVDQFEEVYTACRDDAERSAFLAALAPGGEEPRGDGALVVLAVRSDFYGRCAEHPALARAVGASQVLVGPMRRDELCRAIELPAERAGLDVEPRLVDALLADVEREPGGLPLLSTALLELWRQRDGRTLRLAAYEATGGVRGAVARLAEEAFGRLDAAEQNVARAMLLRLAGEGSGGEVVRRRVAVSELESERDEAVARVLEVLTERRLLTMSASSVEVAHEALLREWPRLRGWLDEDAQGRRTHRRLMDAARDWDERGRDPADLYRGARLAVASEWRSAHESQLNATERAFLDAGRVAAGRAQRRLRLAFAGVAALLAIAVLGGVVALHQRGAARSQARLAEAQRIGVEALAEPHLDRALLLARQGVALSDSLVTRGNLLAVLLRNPAALAVVRGAGTPLRSIDLAPDGRTLVLGDSDGAVEYLDAVTHRRIGAPYKAGESIRGVRFSPDGTRVAVSGYTVGGTATAFVDLLNVRRRRSVRRMLSSLPGYIEFVGGVAFSPDSHVLTAEFVPWPQPGQFQHYVGRWDARSGRSLGPAQPVAPGEKSGPALGGFVAGGRRLVTSSTVDGTTVIRDAGAALRPLRQLRGGGVPADVSSDGRLVVLVGRDRTLRVLDLRTGRSRRLGTRADAPIDAVHFTRDSRELVTAARDGRLTVWDSRRATLTRSVGPLAGRMRQFALSADGRTAYTAGEDGSVIAWDLTGRRGMTRSFRADTGALVDLTAVPGTRSTLAVASRSGHAYLLDGRDPARAVPIAPGGPSDHATAIAVAPDGRTLAIGTADGAVRFADARTGRPLGRPEAAHVGPVIAMGFSGDGQRLVTTGSDRAIYAWDVHRRTIVGPPYIGLAERPTSLSVSPDGTTVVATIVHTDGNGELNILSLPRLRLLAQKRAAPGRQTQFSRDGRRLFYGDSTGQVWMLDTHTWRPVGPPLRLGSGPGWFSLSPDERFLATSLSDGSIQVWDPASGRPIGTPLPGIPGSPARTAFVADGTGLVTIGRDGRGNLWDLRPKSWAQRACALAGRTLSRNEWRNALPEREYAPACAP